MAFDFYMPDIGEGVVEGEIVGATVCDLSTLTPITLTPILIVTDIQVSPRHRRRSPVHPRRAGSTARR